LKFFYLGLNFKRLYRYWRETHDFPLPITCYSIANVLRLSISVNGVGHISYIKVLEQIKNERIPPVLLLYGTESYFIQNIQDKLFASVMEQSGDENISTYDLEETPIQEVVADAETYPFFGEKKLIYAMNPTFLSTKHKKLPFEHDLVRLEQYISNPVDYSVIVFIAPYEKLDNRKKITKVLNKQALVAECNPIKDYEVQKWIKTLSADLHITIEPDAYRVFEAELIVNLHLIQNELRKLALYVGENGIVTKEIAEDLISSTANGSALRLVDTVIDRNLHRAIAIYKDLEKMNEEPIALIALLAFQFRIIFQVKLLKEQGYTQFQMRNQISAHPYVIKIAYEREARFTVDQLEEIFNVLANTDASIKQGKMSKELAFELLLYNLINR